jgi:acyl carrier protein
MHTRDPLQSPPTLDAVVDALHHVLGETTSAEPLTEETGLFGSLPELDSLSLVELITVLEERFGFDIDEDDITAEVFETVGSLAHYVARRSAEH